MAENVNVSTTVEATESTIPIARVTIKDEEAGTETPVDVRTCARGVVCDEGKTVQDHIADLNAHMKNAHNPHQVTAAQVGLGAVDNTADLDKPVSTAQATAIAEAKKAGTDAAAAFATHAANKNNPHGVTAAQVGADTKGAAAAVQANLDAHTTNKNNPHEVTAAQAGAAEAEHTHDASDINSGILPIARGGTGAGTAAGARGNIEVAKPVRATVSFPTSGWTLSSSVYKQTVNCSIAKATMKYANIGPQYSTDASARKLEQEAYAQIAYVDTADGKLTATCWGDTAPGVNLTLIFEGGVE